MSNRRIKIPFHWGVIALILMGLFYGGCSSSNKIERLRLGTTTSVDDSGLLDGILPGFEKAFGVKVEVIAVGTGQALALAKRGDVDVVIVHAPELEIEFVESGFGIDRSPVMYNDFIIVGPSEDPAEISVVSDAVEALKKIRNTNKLFISRGDNSGTHIREVELWKAVYSGTAIDTGDWEWYISVGQGMGTTLNMANEMGAYTLSDRGTYLSQSNNVPNLQILFGGSAIEFNLDEKLYNYYSVILVNPSRHPSINYGLASQFANWITSVETQSEIENYTSAFNGTPLFYANSVEWRSRLLESPPIPPVEPDSQNESAIFWESFRLIFSGDTEFIEVAILTVQVSGSALLLAGLSGIPFGAFLGFSKLRGKKILEIIIYTGMGLPPVVVGLILFLVLSNEGLLGKLGWLFSPEGMILAQSVLAFPIVAGLTSSAVKAVPPELVQQIRSLGATRWQLRWTILRQARLGVIAAILAALGRIISEVGAVMLVGGNIKGSTRVLSSAIILETRQGSFELALALGMVLLGIALMSNVIVMKIVGRGTI